MKKKIDLSLIDQIIDGGTEIDPEPDSIYAFSAHLAKLVPEANPAYQKTLAAQAIGALNNKKTTASPNKLGRLTRDRPYLRRMPVKKKFVLVTTAALFAAMLTLALVPGLGRYMFESIKTIKLGEYTIAEQVNILQTGDPNPPSDDVWVIRTEIGGFAGNTAPGIPPTIQTVHTVEEARQLVDFHIATPGYLPEGYTLKEIQITPKYTQSVFLYYQGPAHEIIIVLMPVGIISSDDPTSDGNTISGSVTSVMTGTITDGQILETELDGKTAAWVDGHTLMWEAENISFAIGGLDLDLETAKQIARSLH